MNLRFVSLILLANVVVGCSADVDSDEIDASEEELQSECTLGKTCPEAIRVARAKSYVDKRAPARLRSDIAVDFPGGDSTPRWFTRTTTRPLRIGEGVRLVVSGDAAGTAGFTVDDHLLFEVIDPASGALLDAGLVGSDPPAKLDGQPIKRLAPPPAWAGVGKGFPYEAGTVDVASILPKDRAFRLRVSSLDFAGNAVVSDIFLRADASAPEPPADPFDPASCQGPRAVVGDFLGYFATAASYADGIGTFKTTTRSRRCHAMTGCTPWAVGAGELVNTNGSTDTKVETGTLAAQLNANVLGNLIWFTASTVKGTRHILRCGIETGKCSVNQDRLVLQYVDEVANVNNWRNVDEFVDGTLTTQCVRLATRIERQHFNDRNIKVETEVVISGRFNR